MLNKRITTNSSSSSSRTNIRPSTWMMLTFTFFTVLVTVNALEERSSTELKSVLPSTATNSVTPRDEIYIDDEGLEGSGRHGEVHDDLEKESDYSGSGFGPDDEDSLSNHHSSSTTHQLSSSSSSGSGGGIGSNTDKTSNNRQDSTNRKDTTRVTEYELGSGIGDNDRDIDEEEDDGDEIVHSINPDHEDDEDTFVTHRNDHIDNYDEHSTITSPNNDDDVDENDADDIDNDNDDDIFTEVTDPNKQDVKFSDKFGEDGTIRKDTAKPSGELDSHTPTDTVNTNNGGNGVLIMNASDEDRTASFFAQPGILAAVIGGAVVGLLCAILVVMFIVYRMRKKDEGSYALDEPKRSPAVNSYAKNANNREFYA